MRALAFEEEEVSLAEQKSGEVDYRRADIFLESSSAIGGQSGGQSGDLFLQSEQRCRIGCGGAQRGLQLP